jgi:hypothetical protein
MMATLTLIGPTPSGGTKAVVIFKDATGRPCERKDATQADVQEQDDEGNVLQHHTISLVDEDAGAEPDATDPKEGKEPKEPKQGKQPGAKGPSQPGSQTDSPPAKGGEAAPVSTGKGRGRVVTLPPEMAPADGEDDDPAEKARLMSDILGGVLDEEALQRLIDMEEQEQGTTRQGV